MDNVYGQVASFYNKNIAVEDILQQDVIEKYLRKCAWNGTTAEELKSIWQVLHCMLAYMDENDVPLLEYLDPYDYQVMICNSTYAPCKDQAQEGVVQDFFQSLRHFYIYLKGNGYDDYLPSMEQALAFFYEDGKFVSPEVLLPSSFYQDLVQSDQLSMEDAERLNIMLEGLLNRVGEYYRNPLFNPDLTRALTLYSGPFDIKEASTQANEEFWFTFWDYFFFDYHLLENDRTPLQYYFEQEKDHLEESERCILQDLLKAKFTVFSIDSVSDEFVQCRNIFTDELLELPIPDYGLPDYNKTLLFGHLHLHGVMMLNYITSVSASEKLRRRIKDEILHQYEIYRCQVPEASLEEFFCRHSMAVRHTINLLAEYAQLKVVSCHQRHLSRPQPSKDMPATVRQNFQQLAHKVGLSRYGQKLCLWLYEDAFSLPALQNEPWDAPPILMAVLILYMNLNGMEFVNIDEILKDLKVVDVDIQPWIQTIYDGLSCVPFDPRYLAEEGFVQALYTV